MTSLKETFFRFYRKNQPVSFFPSEQVLQLPSRLRQIAVMNQKGGCGKTTTAVNLSACLAELGAKVLLVDTDPQAHATLNFGVRGDELERSLYHAFLPDGPPLREILLPTYHPNLKIIPANALLASLQVELVDRPGREHLLSDRLSEVADGFHYVFLDCPPSLNLLTVNALTAATDVLIPLQTHYFSLDGMRELFKTIEQVQADLNPRLQILGILPTLFDHRTKMNRAMLEAIREYFKGKVFESVIHMSSALTESPMMGQPIIRYAPQSRGAKDYQALAEELMRHYG
ncbi:MAG: ParA family protein [Candidatus Omnitrophica bacterium]|nr:ParA family protein [Candidatus Omnitrophota bacterium]